MAMNAILREKRKELGLTQEQVASYLGVSTPAVNKWERGVSYPDVTLLSALARLLKTDLNTLLCFQEELSQKEMGLFLNKVMDKIQQESLAVGFEMAMKKIQEYPSCAEFIHWTAMVLQGALLMNEVSPAEKETYTGQITALYEQVLQCGESKYADRARYMLISRLIGAGAYKQAQEMLDLLPEYEVLDKRSLQATLWLEQGKLTKAAGLLERKIQNSLQEIQVNLLSLTKIAVEEGNTNAADEIAVCAQQMVRLFGLWDYGSYVVPLENAVARKDAYQAIALLKKMLAAILIPWDMEQSLVCRHIHQTQIPKKEEKNAEDYGVRVLPSLLRELETNEEYLFLQSCPEFQQLIRQYRMKCR